MSSKKNKSKVRRVIEGDNSSGLREGSSDSTSLQSSGHEGGGSKNLNSFTVIEFIEKGS